MLPIEENTRIGPVRYRHRTQGLPCHAMRVQDVTLLAICDWVPMAHTWARSVIIPVEQPANMGDWVWTQDGVHFHVSTDAEFRATFGPAQ